MPVAGLQDVGHATGRVRTTSLLIATGRGALKLRSFAAASAFLV